MATRKRSISQTADMCGVKKELDEALCPVCMEHPHNAVLLLCSSHKKGCRPYICDTSYRHSNCLDRFKKLQAESNSSSEATGGDSTTRSDSLFSVDLPEHLRGHNRNERNMSGGRFRAERGYELQDESMREQNDLVTKKNFKCPLCRGDVFGQTVVGEARDYLDLKQRSCTRESCTFVGNYKDLRRHARRVHPRVRPAEVDPLRERAWRRFEHQREHEDIVSAIRSAMPGAVVMGDYVIEESDQLPVERERTTPWWSAFVFFQMLESVESLSGPRARSRPFTRHRRVGGGPSRRYLWGENLLGLQDDEDNDHGGNFTDDGEDEDLNVFADVSEQDASPVRRQRRRLNQSRSSRDRL